MQYQSAVDQPLGTTLRQAREHLGLNQRELATRLGTGHGGISELEKGRDPRHSTLARYLECVSDLSPLSFFPDASCAPPASPAAWRTYRDLYGYVVERVRRTFVVRPSGRWDVTHEALGVECLRGEPGDEAIRANLMSSAALVKLDL